MPITLIEAYLSGKPIISTPVCGAVDIVKEGVNGYLSAGHTKEEYKAAIRQFVTNRESVCATTEKGTGENPYAIGVCAAKYLDWCRN